MTTSEITRKRSALQHEQARLLARLAEIEDELAGLELAEEVQDVLDETSTGQRGNGSKRKVAPGGLRCAWLTAVVPTPTAAGMTVRPSAANTWARRSPSKGATR